MEASKNLCTDVVFPLALKDLVKTHSALLTLKGGLKEHILILFRQCIFWYGTKGKSEQDGIKMNGYARG